MLSLIIALSSWISMSIILENKSIIPFLVEAIALHNPQHQKCDSYGALRYRTPQPKNTRNAIALKPTL
jgi:hypothetical protein